MRHLHLTAIILTMTFFLTGCLGSQTPQTPPDSARTGSQTELQAESPAGAEMRVFSTVKGDVTIPAQPQTIVSDYYLGEFLALGVKPVIASPYSLSNPFLKDYTDGIQPLSITSSETALEMIIEVQPDLIVTLSEADYENFSKIAPTVYIPYGNYSDEELFYYIADMLGKREEAEQYMASFEADVLAVRDEVQAAVGGRSVSLVEVWPSEVYVMGSHFARGGRILFDLWQLKAPQPVQERMVDGDTSYEVISLELLPEYAGDIIFYGVLADADSSFVDQSNVWRSLPAVQNGLVKEYEQVAFMHFDPITLRGQLEFYTEYFRTLE